MTSKTYSISLKLLGEMSQLPDSQKIFGAICYAYADMYGHGIVGEFTKAVKNKQIDIAISNILPKGLLPVPKSYILRKHGGEDKDVYQELKKRDFADGEQIKKFIKNPKEILNDTGDYAFLEPYQQAHNNTEGRESEPFSVLRTVCFKHSSRGEGDKGNEVCREFEFFFRCEFLEQNKNHSNEESSQNHSSNILGLLKKGKILTLGRLSSQGYNLFEITSQTPCDKDFEYSGETTVYLNLGMLLPDDINYSFGSKNKIGSSLDLFTSERRPYAPQAWKPNEHEGWFISFIAPGSVVVMQQNRTVAALSKCIYCKKWNDMPGEVKSDAPGGTADAVDDESRLLFGNAVLLPIEGWC
ncbi:MAG: hypothetical protein LBL49_00640 [Clostridiales Family XIII bacterium]|jgi:CRISPR type III-A-associated RAMP protein Csm4|nr:hypothetical protein [Clostridiales Family XIII bacterium]